MKYASASPFSSIVALWIVFFPLAAVALDTLPYSSRSHPYNGWSTPPQGDIRTVGMSGATMGLADTFIAALDNPAGLAMTLNGVDSNFAQDIIYDGNIQNYDSYMGAYNFGIATSNYPWGFSFGYVSHTQEGQEYSLATVPNDTAKLSVETRHLQLSVARIFLKNRLSLGLGLILGQAQNEIDFAKSVQLNTAFHSYAFSGTLGASFRLPGRFILGAGYRLPMTFNVNSDANPTAGLPGFFQSVKVPSRLGIGVGWIPNRFFRSDFSVFLIGSTNDTTLLRDDATPVGQYMTVQPRLGFAYNFVDFKELKGTLFYGLYLETSRIQDSPSRFHGTSGLELKPWIFSLGWGIDFSNNYKNYLVSLGVDVIRIMQKLDLIPTPPHPPYSGFLANPATYSSLGLPATLTSDGKPKGASINPIQVGLDIPNRIKEKASEFGNDVNQLGKDVVKAFDTDSNSVSDSDSARPRSSERKKKTSSRKTRSKKKHKSLKKKLRPN